MEWRGKRLPAKGFLFADLPGRDFLTSDMSQRLSLLVDTTVIFFGFWTIYCNLFSFWHLGLSALTWFSPLLLCLVYLFCRMLPEMETSHFTHHSFPEVNRRITIPDMYKWVAALVIVLLFFLTKSLVLFWVLSLCYLVPLHLEAHCCRNEQQVTHPFSQKDFFGIAAIALSAALVTLIAHRPDADDATYLNSIVYALDFIHAPIMKFDGIHGIANLPINTPVYRVHSYEMFIAFLANSTHLSPILISHLLLPPIFACFVIFANWLVVHKLFPQHHLPALFFVFLIFLFWGDSHRTFGNFSLVRLFQGKAIMISAFIPLILFYAMEFVERRTTRSWMLLFLVQIGAVGFSSSALVVAPLASTFVLLGAWRPEKDWNRVLAWGMVSSIYVIVLGLSLLPDVQGFSGFAGNTVSTESFNGTFDTGDGLSMVMGEGWLKYFALFCLLTCSIKIRGSRFRLFITGFPLVAVFFLFSPWTSDFMAYATAGNMSWRVFWALPFPLFMGIAMAGIFSFNRRLMGIKMGSVLFVIAVFFCALWSGKWTTSLENGTTISMPHYKIDEFYGIAEAIKELTPDKGMVLAPVEIAKWLPTFQKYPYVIVSRKMYLRKLRRFIGEDEFQARSKLFDCVNNRAGSEQCVPLIVKEAGRRKLNTIIMKRELGGQDELAHGLESLGFQKQWIGEFDVWISNSLLVK